jgi:dipeptidase E
VPGRILAIGGHALSSKLEDLVLELGGPKVLFVPTAAADDDALVVEFYASFGARAEASHAPFFPWPPEDLREHALSRDVIYVSGGNTANALAIWRTHGFDEVLREAWEAGVLLAGWSAGMICWFASAVTDSFGPELAPLHDGLGFLPGSACPHFDGEARRRPVYTGLVRNGVLPPGYAADDGVGILFEDAEVAEVVSCRDGSTAYRVTAEGAEPLPVRLL